MLIKFNQSIFIVSFFLTVILFIVYGLVFNYQYSNNSVLLTKIIDADDDVHLKYILIWDEYWDRPERYNEIFQDGNEIFKNCPASNCFCTRNRSLVPMEEFDAVIFHGTHYEETLKNKPTKRRSEQIYIYFNLESPFNTPTSLSYSPNFFNWTFSYRLDADIIRPYGRIKKGMTNYTLPSVADIQERPRKISWFVSHCNSISLRDMLRRKINRFMHTDIYGRCGKLKCPRSIQDECYDMMEQNYKFYLSFENSICKDYVTEKLYNILEKNVVPIVYGGVDYDVIAPPLSVIDVSNFDAVEDLVVYLEFLDANPEEYIKYFEWKKSYYVDRSKEQTLCDLCQKLNEPRETHFYENVLDWLNAPGLCKTDRELPQIVFD